MSAHGGKANKTGGHRSTGLKAASYTATTPPAPTPPAAQGLGMAGQKALIIRAKHELAPLEDPSSAITN